MKAFSELLVDDSVVYNDAGESLSEDYVKVRRVLGVPVFRRVYHAVSTRGSSGSSVGFKQRNLSTE